MPQSGVVHAVAVGGGVWGCGPVLVEGAIQQNAVQTGLRCGAQASVRVFQHHHLITGRGDGMAHGVVMVTIMWELTAGTTAEF